MFAFGVFPIQFHVNPEWISLLSMYEPHVLPSPKYCLTNSTDYEDTNAFSTTSLLLLPS